MRRGPCQGVNGSSDHGSNARHRGPQKYLRQSHPGAVREKSVGTGVLVKAYAVALPAREDHESCASSFRPAQFRAYTGKWDGTRFSDGKFSFTFKGSSNTGAWTGVSEMTPVVCRLLRSVRSGIVRQRDDRRRSSSDGRTADEAGRAPPSSSTEPPSETR
jgi:hypothetical protein